MPQLNPTPWFFILVISWTTLLMIFKQKASLSTTNSPIPQDQMMHQMTPWNWPWT